MERDQPYAYGVTAVNLAHDESRLSELRTVVRAGGRVKRYQAPAPAATATASRKLFLFKGKGR